MDGVDAGLLRIDDGFRLEGAITRPFSRTLKQHLVGIVNNPERVSLDELGQLDTAIANAFADAAIELLNKHGLGAADIAAIGSHGQTIRHGPGGDHPFTLQIGNPSIIAARTGVQTISDFRSRDVALGGEGAPLAPAFHHAAFASTEEVRVVVNIGGIANLSVLHPDGSVTGHDTGPGNVLMDAWIEQTRGDGYDADGAWAATGKVSESLLEACLADDYFSKAPPKSTGRELFSMPWLIERIGGDQLAAEDVQATITELTARSISADIERYAPQCRLCLVCGGGAYNGHLMRRLAALLGETRVEATDQHGIDASSVEAAAFAWLAWRTCSGKSGNLPSVTGATTTAILGSITPP